ncbi:MAG: tetratricopeptide repeat protein [Coriobacteriia bacterium]|nr:tetratricopeptide repeat protein [Coriobacteriia bacterium]
MAGTQPDDLTHDGESDPGVVPSSGPPPRRASMFDDPVVKLLSVVAAVVIVLFLSTVVAALYLGILGSDTPRTRMERDLNAYEFQTSAGTRDPEVWRAYIGALVDSGQLQKAQQAVDRGMKVIDDRPGADMMFAQAQVHFSSKKYEKAVETATEGMAALTAYHEAQLKVDGSPEQKGQQISQNYWGMLYLRALSYVELGEFGEAIADFDEYLDERGGASDVYVLRGDAKVEVGDEAGAEEDYRTALNFIQDNKGALDGLEKLGVKP